MPESAAEPVAALLRRSLSHLAAEIPCGLRRLAAVLGPLVVEIVVDGEVFALHGGDTVTVSDDSAPWAEVGITTSRATLRALLDADTTLAQAVEADLVRVRGRLDDVLRAHDALLAYVHATVRAPSSAGLVAALDHGAAR